MAMRDLDGDVLELVQREAVTPDEVAKRLSISWATANEHLLKLVATPYLSQGSPKEIASFP
jgi:predicted ArsR family transcriptional regulator